MKVTLKQAMVYFHPKKARIYYSYLKELSKPQVVFPLHEFATLAKVKVEDLKALLYEPKTNFQENIE